MGRRLSGNGGGRAPRAVSLVANATSLTGVQTTLGKYGLLAPVSYAKTGGSSNLTIAASTGAVSAAAAIATGSQSVSGTITGADACVIPFALTLNGAAATLPAAPTMALTPGGGQVSIAWTDGATGGATITAHKLYRGTATGGEVLIGTIATASPYVDTGLTNGTAYYYQLSSVNSVGEGARSAEQSAMPNAAASPIYRVMLVAGQSNEVGRSPLVTGTDTEQANIKQYPNVSSNTATYRTIRDSVFPLYHPENTFADNNLSPANYAAKQVAATLPAGEILLIVPCAFGNTQLVGSLWAAGSPGGSLYEAAIAQANAAMAAVLAINPSSTLHSIQWIQGENDAQAGITQAAYSTGLTDVINGFRSRITGATAAPVVIGGMCPESISGSAGYPAIDAAHKAIANAMTGVSFVGGPIGVSAAPHYTAAGARTHGTNMGNAVAGSVVVSFDNVVQMTAEGNTGTTAFNFQVYRSTKVGAASVPITFAAGTTDAADYPGGVLPSGLTVNFVAGSNAATFTLNVNGDTTVESDEAATLTLAPTGGYVLGARATATLSILNDDSAGSGTNLMAAARVQAMDSWALAGGTVTANVAANPVSGTTNADRFASDTATSAHTAATGTTSSASLTSGSSYAVAIDVKWESGTPYLQIVNTASQSTYANFDIQAGTVTATGIGALSSSITALGGGWYRCAFAFVAGAAGLRAVMSTWLTTNPANATTVQSYAGVAGSYVACNQQICAGTVANVF